MSWELPDIRCAACASPQPGFCEDPTQGGHLAFCSEKCQNTYHRSTEIGGLFSNAPDKDVFMLILGEMANDATIAYSLEASLDSSNIHTEAEGKELSNVTHWFFDPARESIAYKRRTFGDLRDGVLREVLQTDLCPNLLQNFLALATIPWALIDALRPHAWQHRPSHEDSLGHLSYTAWRMLLLPENARVLNSFPVWIHPPLVLAAYPGLIDAFIRYVAAGNKPHGNPSARSNEAKIFVLQVIRSGEFFRFRELLDMRAKFGCNLSMQEICKESCLAPRGGEFINIIDQSGYKFDETFLRVLIEGPCLIGKDYSALAWFTMIYAKRWKWSKSPIHEIVHYPSVVLTRAYLESLNKGLETGPSNASAQLLRLCYEFDPAGVRAQLGPIFSSPIGVGRLYYFTQALKLSINDNDERMWNIGLSSAKKFPRGLKLALLTQAKAMWSDESAPQLVAAVVRITAMPE